MKLLKTVIIVCSAVGAYTAVKKYKNKKKPVRQKRLMPAAANRYKNLPPDELKEQFKQRIAAGDWLSDDEYVEMMQAMHREKNFMH